MGVFDRLAELEREGRPAALATVVRDRGSVPRRAGTRMIILRDGRTEGTIGGGEMEARVVQEARQAIHEQRPRLLHYSFSDPGEGDPGVCGGEIEVFVEPLGLRPTLVVVGGGHVGRAVAYLASWLGFRLIVSDDRPEYCTPEAVPGADQYVQCALSELAERIAADENTHWVLTTRGVSLDVEGLPAVLARPAAFIGVIGSRKRWETTRKELIDKGVPAEDLGRVTSPIGLELNAETPEEIAVSILAQIIQQRRQGSGEPMARLARPSA
ncbi:MAG: XdhC family protein [Anaerolineales bacterium]|nr:XdhC family protein [Anaerolineales bacterium]